MTTIDPRIFRAYDIRGKAGEQLTEEAAMFIGRAFGEEVQTRSGKQNPRIVVGRDARLSSPDLLDALKDGLQVAGCKILDMGETPSPLNYFTICHLGLDGGAQVTASHNPGRDNGIKLQLKDAEAFAGNDLQRLRENIEKIRNAECGPLRRGYEGQGMRNGSMEQIDAISPYLEHLKKMFGDIGKGTTVVVDCGNGVAGPVYVQAMKNTGARVMELCTEPDGNFPHHPADPSKHSTLKDLQEIVVKNKADLGLAFDGDGDRLGIVDENGMIRTADEILLLLARDHLSRHPGSPVIFTVSNSSILETEILTFGGKPTMCKVGHSFVEHAMREHKAQLGGEQSGHFFCAEDYYRFDDALVAALRVLTIHSACPGPRSLGEVGRMPHAACCFSSLFTDFPSVFPALERRPYCRDDRKGEVIKLITAYFQKQYPVNTLDGARIDCGEGAWAGIRQSNTSPCISVCVEARSPEKLREVENVVLGHLRTYPEFRDIE